MNEDQGLELSIIINDASCRFDVNNRDVQLFADRVCRIIEDIKIKNSFSQKYYCTSQAIRYRYYNESLECSFGDLCSYDCK